MGQWGVKHYLTCTNCKERFLDKGGKRTSDLKRGKLKNAFCGRDCAMKYRCKRKENDKCKRCKMTRRELSPFKHLHVTGVTFSNGYCQPCYALLKAYNNDETLVTAHELTQQLKKETTNDIANQKHCRSSQHASGCNRWGTEGKGGSSTSKGDFGSFFTDFAIRPTRL